MWGQDSYRSRNQKRSRIIPTRVGTRSFLDNRKSWNKDHPHACGDKVQYQTWFLLLSGSSPRVWGQGSASLEKLFKIGIIPTRVGTSHTKRIVTAARQDHPHACGDKLLLNGNGFPDTGSSPRVWGQGLHHCCCSSFHRIIPTRVGTSFYFCLRPCA